MNNHDVLSVVRDGLSTIDMDTPAETLIAAGNARRRRRRLYGVAAAGALFAAGLGMAVPALSTGSTPATNPASQPAAAQLAAFRLAANGDGTDTLTLPKSQAVDPDALRRALDNAGIPALIRVGSFCHSRTDPPGLDQVLAARTEDGTVVLVITPSAIPSGAELSFGFKPKSDPGTKERVQFGLTWSSGPQICETFG